MKAKTMLYFCVIVWALSVVAALYRYHKESQDVCMCLPATLYAVENGRVYIYDHMYADIYKEATNGSTD